MSDQLHKPPNLPLFFLLFLVRTLFLTPIFSVSLHPIIRNMIAQQIPGNYFNVQIQPNTGFCPDNIRIAQVEPIQGTNAVLYIIPHFQISLPFRDNAGSTSCSGTPITFSTVTNTSSTVLRRSDQVPLDESFDLIRQFRLKGESFFLGLEVGSRVCGLTTVENGTVSMWMAPSAPISASAGNITLNFNPAFKYIFYFPESRPCLYQGNAGEVGIVKEVPSKSPTPSPSFRPSPSQFPIPSSPGIPFVPSPNPSPFVRASFSVLPIFSSFIVPPTEAPVCFPANSKVRRNDGEMRRMDELRVGERVLVDVRGRWRYSTVFAFTHSDDAVSSAFVKVETESGRSLELTSGHYLYVNGHVVRAGDVQVGDWMIDEVWGGVRVVWVGCVVGKGLFSPQTLHGNLVVDGVLATTYSSVARFVQTAHALMAPLRFMEYRLKCGLVERMRCWMGIGT